MSLALDDYVYCSPFLNVVSLDHLLDHFGEGDRSFDIPSPQLPTETQIDRRRVYDTIHGAVDLLPPRQGAVVRAIYLSGLTVTQTARHLKISAPAVVKLRTKALSNLLRVLEPKRDQFFT